MAQTNKSKEFNRARNRETPESIRGRVEQLLPIESLPDLIKANPELADSTNRNSIIHSPKASFDTVINRIDNVIDKVQGWMTIGSSLDTDINQE